jgi:flavorubredoxin
VGCKALSNEPAHVGDMTNITESMPSTSMPTTRIAAKTRLAPTQIAPDTFVIHDHIGEGQAPVLVPVNTMVIRGAEPVVVDTGVADNRERYFEDLFSIVEPDDIRWVYISHDDIDHTGNLNELMSLAPNATLVVNWFLQERMGAELAVSPLRQRWVVDGESFDVGDRTLSAVRPPVYDSPTTRGLYDPTTGVYWASDAFGAPMITPIADASDLPTEMFDLGMASFNRYVAPWIEIARDDAFQASVDRIARLAPSTVAGCHSPVIGGDLVDRAIDVMRRSPSAEILPMADQSVLDEIQLQMMSVGA